jgi:hypothetical protein
MGHRERLLVSRGCRVRLVLQALGVVEIGRDAVRALLDDRSDTR